ncbi:Clusterin associated protein 1 [Spironucleus salmonicida]|uniref:Clusterin associated protein 1 n=1 Tax=Spironucleus salmonicida TaxID=348837 RepID=V6LB49_9EUKA|nr:Clusterin associated protein 1 [Spironucleus salmonicida]|eukprot:EST41463.1 Clusterin associated protein 1 [Spironucleus salmonicida]
MSYSETKQLTHLLSQLNFTVPVSLDSFRVPNFRLTAQILQFLLSLALPDVQLSHTITSQEDRVYFVTTAIQVAQQRLHLKLSARRLYAADSNAVRELLKLANELSKYLYLKPEVLEVEGLFADLTGIAGDLRNVSSDLVEKSTQLLINLRNSGDNAAQVINQALLKQPDVMQLQQAVQNRINALSEETRRFDEDMTTSRREKIHLQELLTQKTSDISRMQDRLDSIRTAKPPFIAELEQVESELTKIHNEYAKKHRSLSYLESQLKFSDAKQNRKRQLQDQGRKNLIDIINRKEKEDIIGGAVDPFMVTPAPNKSEPARPINIMEQQIPEDEEEEYVYEEEVDEEEQEVEKKPQGRQAPVMKEESEELVEEDNGEEEYEEEGEIEGDDALDEDLDIAESGDEVAAGGEELYEGEEEEYEEVEEGVEGF